ncbi:MAG: DUF2341 domain-containing protein [Kiritimatiellae bacterium]|nr:DUF2341 domain-containing protein [Kiritimatiellia bacterium]
MKFIRLALAAILTLSLTAKAAIDLDTFEHNPNGFSRGVVFTVNGYDANRETLTDFPVLVRISKTAIAGFDYDDLMFPSTGDDIAFLAADGTALAYDIDTWDPTGTSLVWVKLPSMAQGTQFVMYWRSSKSGKTLNGNNAFSDYVGVWHLG